MDDPGPSASVWLEHGRVGRRRGGHHRERAARAGAPRGSLTSRQSTGRRAAQVGDALLVDQVATISAGRERAQHTCVPPAAAIAQGWHQPLQWNMGRVHR